MNFLQKISFVIFVSTGLQAQTNTSFSKKQVIKETTVISKDLTILNDTTYDSDLRITENATVTINTIGLYNRYGAITVYGNPSNYGTLNIKNSYMEIHNKFENFNTINIRGHSGLNLEASIINRKGGKFNMLYLDNLSDVNHWFGSNKTEYKIKFYPGSTLFLPEKKAKIWPIKIKGNAAEPVNIVLHKDIISSHCRERSHNLYGNASVKAKTEKDNLNKIISSFNELQEPIILTQIEQLFFDTIFDAVNSNFKHIDDNSQNILLNKLKHKIKFIVIDSKNYNVNSLNETNFEYCSYDQQVSCDDDE